jgi:pimeloyl-ACP methyl ester carboxylesterase
MKPPDLLLLHGALGAADQYAPLLPILRAAGKVHILDFEGHGKAAFLNRRFKAEHFVENVLDYLEENKLDRVDIFGYSMGGFIALCLARKHPKRVRRIFTFATKFDWTQNTAEREASYLDPDLIIRRTPEFARALEARHGADRWKDVLKKTKKMTLAQGREKTLKDQDFQQIIQPVRLSMGDRDKMVNLEETIRIYRLLPHAQLQIFPSTPHLIEQTSVKMLANAMASFFSRIDICNNGRNYI